MLRAIERNEKRILTFLFDPATEAIKVLRSLVERRTAGQNEFEQASMPLRVVPDEMLAIPRTFRDIKRTAHNSLFGFR